MTTEECNTELHRYTYGHIDDETFLTVVAFGQASFESNAR